jgi:hypothetical protein
MHRLVGTMRREFLDHVLFWNAGDLERKLADYVGSPAAGTWSNSQRRPDERIRDAHPAAPRPDAVYRAAPVGARTSLAGRLNARYSLVYAPPPTATMMYCLPSTIYVIGDPL